VSILDLDKEDCPPAAADDRFLRPITGTVSFPAFFSPENVARIVGRVGARRTSGAAVG
jgi:hypothetical protein